MPQTDVSHDGVDAVWCDAILAHAEDGFNHKDFALAATGPGRLSFWWKVEDGESVIGWEPDLNEGGTKNERVYTFEGRESLTDGDWGPTNAASRFFRVRVSMP